jgi:hypothetical protein
MAVLICALTELNFYSVEDKGMAVLVPMSLAMTIVIQAIVSVVDYEAIVAIVCRK